MLANNGIPEDVNSLQYVVVTSKGRLGPFPSRAIAESQSLTAPVAEGEVPQIIPITGAGNQLLLG